MGRRVKRNNSVFVRSCLCDNCRRETKVYKDSFRSVALLCELRCSEPLRVVAMQHTSSARRRNCFFLLFAVGMWLLGTSGAFASDAITFHIGYLRLDEKKLALSVLDVPPPDDGIAGAKVAINDNNTTGKF